MYWSGNSKANNTADAIDRKPPEAMAPLWTAATPECRERDHI
jgi:hypothetical protein